MNLKNLKNLAKQKKRKQLLNNKNVIVIGAGLAGSEAAWQLANRGIHVDLYEMRPREEFSCAPNRSICRARM